MDLVRQELIQRAKTVVVKVGTNVLTDNDGRLDINRLQSLADQLQRIRAAGRQVVLVSSGAIGAGMGRLGLPARPVDLPHLQACAAIGQNFLMRAYQECLEKHGVTAAQILLTAGDFDSRGRYLNVRNTILTLFEWNVLPIINENDTVSVAEIRFGDNDHLAAMVTNLLQAELLVLLTNVDGLFDGDPRDVASKKLDTVAHIDGDVMDLAGASKSTLGTGGMRSKLRAARLATAAGESVIMANGSISGVLDAIFAGEPVGTLFLAHGSSMPAWKRWLGFTARPKGTIIVDAGARQAVEKKGRSLLPIGIVRIQDEFEKGDVVALCDLDGHEFARGLTNYPSADAAKIIGLRTEQISEILGDMPYEEMVHRDNLVVTGQVPRAERDLVRFGAFMPKSEPRGRSLIARDDWNRETPKERKREMKLGQVGLIANVSHFRAFGLSRFDLCGLRTCRGEISGPARLAGPMRIVVRLSAINRHYGRDAA